MYLNSIIEQFAGEEPCYAGVPMSSIVEQGYGVGDVISLLWFKRSLPRYCTHFIEVRLLISIKLLLVPSLFLVPANFCLLDV